MTFNDELKRKDLTLIAPRIRFELIYDALDDRFEGGRIFVTLRTADRSEHDVKALPISLFGFTSQERAKLETLFQDNIDLMLAETTLVLDDQQHESGSLGPFSLPLYFGEEGGE